MSTENVKKFYEFGKGNEKLSKEILEAALNGNIVEFAKEKGFEFTKEEHDEFIENDSSDENELPDEQLEKVAGGIHWPELQFSGYCTKCKQSSDWVSIKNMKKIYKWQKRHIEFTTTHFPFEPHLIYIIDQRMH